MRTIIYTLLLAALVAAPAWAGKADVLDVQVQQEGDGAFSFSVTVRHADEGWDHYADRWEVIAPDGKVLGTRVLAHPHVDEQPFTRSLGGVAIPPEIREVIVRARDSKQGWGGKTMTIALPGR